MDVNEHERLSNITLKTQNQVKEQHLICYSAFHNHSSHRGDDLQQLACLSNLSETVPSWQLSGTFYFCR